MKRLICILLILVVMLTVLPFQGDALAAENVWVKKYYTDIFGDATEDYYIINKSQFTGTYNSETESDEPLGVEVVVDDSSVSFIFYKENKKMKNSRGVDIPYNVAVKGTDGNQYASTGLMPDGSDRISLDSANYKLFIDLFCVEDGTVSFYVEEATQKTNTYVFKVKCDNFLSLYDQEYIVPKKAAHYEAALQYLEQEDYLDAWDELAAAGDYKDSEEKLAETIDSLGGAAGISRIGYNYDVGDGVEQNYKLAFAWYKKAAELGSSYAMNNLGVLYQWGRGIEQDSEKATEWYQKAAELGNTTAMSNLGFMLLEKGSAQDYEEIFDLFKKAAEQGDSAAMSNLGHMYQNGYGTTQDYEKALHWYQKAADLGYAGAMYNLGTMYQDGLGIEQDYTKAFELYQKAAVLDDSMSFAMNNLGASYEFGHGTDIDFQKALEWYHKATEAGLNVSKDNIQRMLDSGKVTEEDLAKAGIEGYSVQSAAETDTTEIMTYTEYASADIDTPVCVETYVQAHQSWWDGKLTVYTQDQDGAYFIYNMACSEEDADRMVPGTKIRVTGYKAEWAGEVEIVDATFEYVEGDSFIAEPIDLTALLGTEDLVSYQNQLVAFKGMTVEAYDEIGAAFAYKNETGKTDDLYFKVSKNGKTYEFCVEYYLCGNDTDVYKAVEALKVGDIVDLEGFLYWYEGVNLHTTGISTGR